MSEQNLIGIARELIDAFNAGDTERFKKHVTADVVYDEVGTQRKMQGADAWVQAWEAWRQALPDVKGTITSAVVTGVHRNERVKRNGRIHESQRTTITGSAANSSTLSCNACVRWPVSRACIARVDPHIGRHRPVMAWNGHGG